MRLLLVLRMPLTSTMFLRSRPRLVVRLFVITVRLLSVSMRLLKVAVRLFVVAVWLLRIPARRLVVAVLPLILLLMQLLLLPLLLLLMHQLLLMLLLLVQFLLLMLLLLILRPAFGAMVVVERVRLLRPHVALRAMIVVVAHRALCGHGVRMSAVVLRIEAAIGTCRLEMLLLERGCADVPFVHCMQLVGRRIVPDSAGAAAVCHVAFVHDCVVLHHGAIDICVVDVDIVYAHNCGVVFETMVVPPAADKANAHVAESVVHAAIEAHVRSPISGMEDVDSA